MSYPNKARSWKKVRRVNRANKTQIKWQDVSEAFNTMPSILIDKHKKNPWVTATIKNPNKKNNGKSMQTNRNKKTTENREKKDERRKTNQIICVTCTLDRLTETTVWGERTGRLVSELNSKFIHGLRFSFGKLNKWWQNRIFQFNGKCSLKQTVFHKLEKCHFIE